MEAQDKQWPLQDQEINFESYPQGNEAKSCVQYFNAYKAYFEGSVDQSKKHVNSFAQFDVLDLQGKRYEFSYQIDFELNSSEMVILSVFIANFCLKISLLNVKGCNPLLKHRQSKTGNYGKVYYLKFLGQTTAFKVFAFTKEAKVSQMIRTVIKQYSIMKVCSVLQCAPLLNNSCGFDLIVYDDSVMFSMEKCKAIQSIDKQTVDQIRSNLGMIHDYRVIHFDIKPDNIMLSPHFKKAVFIDFGFSSIVKEELGQKTYTSFRGSPAFCSKQMNGLLGESESFGFVDAYYNDLYGLQQSLSLMKSQLQAEGWSHLLQSDEEEGRFLSSEDGEMQKDLMISLLKYKLLQNQREGIIRLLRFKDSVLIKESGNQVLQILKDRISQQLFELIYSTFRKQINTFVEKRIIQNYFKRNSRLLRSHQPNLSFTQNIFRQRIIEEQSNSDNQIQPKNLEKYKQFLSIQNVFSNPVYEQKSKQILIESLRFDVKNNSVTDKIKLSKKFNCIFGHESKENLSSLVTTFRILFDYCINQPRTEWKKKYIFVINTQLMMLGTDFTSSQCQKFIGFLSEANQTVQNQIRYCLQLHKLRCLLYFRYPVIESYQCCKICENSFYDKIFEFGQKHLQKIAQQNSSNTDAEIRMICLAINQFIQQKDGQIKPKNSQKQGNELKKFHYIEILKKFNFSSNVTLIKQLIQHMNVQIIQKNIQQDPNLKSKYLLSNSALYELSKSNIKQGFHYTIYYLFNWLSQARKIQEIIQMLTRLISQINCPQVSSNFKFQLSIFAYSNDVDIQNIHKFSLLLTKNGVFWAENLQFQYTYIFHKIETSKHNFFSLYPQLVDFFWELCFSYQQINNQILTLHTMQALMSKYNVAFFLSKYSQFPQAIIQQSHRIIAKFQQQ